MTVVSTRTQPAVAAHARRPWPARLPWRQIAIYSLALFFAVYLLALLFQRLIVQGLAAGSVKG
jgi:ABC-type glycerol-3-phosphate transport system permease component